MLLRGSVQGLLASIASETRSGSVMAGLLIAVPSLVVLASITSSSFAASAEFKDVSGNAWVSRYVQFLKENGVITGYPDGSFRPDKDVTRAEFATILAESQKIPMVNLAFNDFKDVPKKHWAANPIRTVVGLGWMEGYPNDRFAPNKSITTAELYTVSGKLLGGPPLSKKEAAEVLSRFADERKVPGWARAAIASAVSRGAYVSEVSPKRIEPLKNATRAEVATVIAKLMDDSLRTPVDNENKTPPPPREEKNMPPPAPELTLAGKLKKTVEMGGWVVTDDTSGKKYLLMDLTPALKSEPWFKEGTPVKVTGSVKEGVSTFFMEGTPFGVTKLEPAE